MKVSHLWLKELLPGLPPAPALADALVSIGFEIESMATMGPSFSGVVVGRVDKVAPHPNADRLRVCEVSDGAESFAVVCGAPNVAEGQRIAFAKIGAVLPGDFKIKKSKIRGAESNGMICSSEELGLPENGVKVDGILVLPEGSALGSDFSKTLGPADTILDVTITPNRPDCLSHLGLARELAIKLGLKVNFSYAQPAASPSGPMPPSVAVADSAQCPRYRGRLIDGVSVGPSPDWLAGRLRSLGLKPINNVVDVTNYVLHLTGQPLHAFDADRLHGARLDVRDAKPGEKFLGLDGKEYALGPEHLVIADADGPVAAAGVIGGQTSGVTSATRRVFLEAAQFKPGRVRKGAKRMACRTDSSYRFERGIDPAGVEKASDLAAKLILELAGGTAGPASDTNPKPPARAPIRTTALRMNEILGSEYPVEKILGLFEALSASLDQAPHFKGADASEEITLFPPSWRLDLETPWDLAEEIGRHLGYDQIRTKSPLVRLPDPAPAPLKDLEDSLRSRLIALGLWEAYNYDFLSDAEFRKLYPAAPEAQPPRLLNPLSEDWALLRPTLLGGLLRSAALNFNRGARAVRFFEFGRVYRMEDGKPAERPCVAGLLTGLSPEVHWKGPGEAPDFYAVKALVERLLEGQAFEAPRKEAASAKPVCFAPEDALFHPRAACAIRLKGIPAPLGTFGLLHPDLTRRWDLEGAAAAFELDLSVLAQRPARAAKFKPYTIYPSTSRDSSFFVPSELPYAEEEACLSDAGIAELSRADLVDVFTGQGVPAAQKSLTVRLSFSRIDGTLRDEQVQSFVDALVAALTAKLSARLRA